MTRSFSVLATAAGLAALSAPGVAEGRPNIVLVITDDQRADALDLMPNVRALLMRRGVTFANAFATNPICCPSRTTILTGRTSRSTGVWSNRTPFGAWDTFRASGAENRTIAVALRRAGYHTAFFGKYLNRYAGPTIPPGWSSWTSFWAGWPYVRYSLNVNGRLVRYGAGPADYSTDVLARRAARFIRGTRGPFFLYFAPAAPHAPALPAARHASIPLSLPPFDPPSLRETDLSDKPRYVQNGAVTHNPTFRERQYRSLLEVDDAVNRILNALARSGKLRTTLVLFTSDNGVQWGEHGFPAARKAVPYESSIRVPLIARYDALVPRARSERRLVTNVDIAPTIARAAGIRIGTEGRSMLPLLRDLRVDDWRRRVAIENMGGEVRGDGIPTYCGLRTERWSYVLYETNEEELYDLEADPYQLENAARSRPLRALKRTLRSSLRRTCFPTPPGFLPAKLCTIEGTRGPDLLAGGPRADAICLRGGRDRVSAGSGPDVVYAPSATRRALSRMTFGAPGWGPPGSRIRTGPGNDRILVRNGLRDAVACGPGIDRVVADRFDVLTRCERVARPPHGNTFSSR